MSKESSTLLPIGTVVKLKKVEKPIMIYGRNQRQKRTNAIYDYIGVPYPEGNLTEDFNVFFNRNIIDGVIHLGLISPEEKLMREKVEEDLRNSQKENQDE
ncbi:hypothetical protein Q75_00600 [Bacillus coahuilensis p1.1.43]|uniref:DUF4176 domain-containing protein n=1 Tax=Bacillus coahuilensis p1.1.43 TaxID=1150625 RepID=A0A147KCQ0_9BACI|nr:DUF4176 domain-containing protein [Bacillus coahuilensis]KUP09454.1 hypothetical protein Q75_00600 [Bacillus coahuilensis p1.1.43]